MTPTSEERREVAARLRDCIVYAKKHDLNGDCDMGSDKCVETRNTLYNDIASCIEEYGNFNLSAEQVFTRLADLIYPARGDEAGWSDALTVEALEYIYALESALVHLSAEEEREKIVSLMCAVRDRFAPHLSETLHDWMKDAVVDD
jgi:hypothetical protein